MTRVYMSHCLNTYVLRHEPRVEVSCHSQSGGSTPRAGLNPKEKEERRRELDRMREEDRARRAADAVSSYYVWGILPTIFSTGGLDRSMSLTYAPNMIRYHLSWNACRLDAARPSGLIFLPLPSGRNVSGMSVDESKSEQGRRKLRRRIRGQKRFLLPVSWDSVG